MEPAAFAPWEVSRRAPHAPGAALCPALLGTAINSTCVLVGSKNGDKYTAIFLSEPSSANTDCRSQS
jgi:hypothetical protein